MFSHEEFNAILRSCRVSRTAQSFFESELWIGLLLISLDTRLWRKLSWILDSPCDVSSSATKEQSLLSNGAVSPGSSFPSFLSFEKVWECGLLLLGSWALALVEPELLFFAWIGKPLDLLSTWKSQTFVRSCFQRFRKHEFHGYFTVSFQYWASIAGRVLEAGKMFASLWWPFIFDTFGESVVSLLGVLPHPTELCG